MNGENIPTAREMGEKLGSLNRLLYQEKLIKAASHSLLFKISRQLKELKQARKWEYTIKPLEAIKFVPIQDKKLGQIAPRVYIDVAVNPSETEGKPPFTRLNTTIEVVDLPAGDLQSRWHIDLANRKADETYQAGPLFHLQGGGHKPQAERIQELKVSIPRWTIPPMELILTCEMIIANFYPEKWDKMSTQKKWLELIQVAQSICYPVYFQRVQECLSQQKQSVLRALWAQEWK